MAQTSCPSCPLQTTDYDDQLATKAARLRRAFEAYRSLADIDIAAPSAAPRQHGYRNRARMVVCSDAEGADDMLGFYESGSRRVVPVGRCRAHHPQLAAVLDAVRQALADDATLRNFARFVDARCTAGWGADGREAAIVTLAGDQSGAAELDAVVDAANAMYTDFEASLDALDVSVHLNLAEHANQSVLSGEQRCVGGDATLAYAVGGHTFAVPPTAFFQVNLDQLDAVHRRIAELAADAAQPRPSDLGELYWVDLYCGVGVHGVVLAADTVAADTVAADANVSDAARLVGTDHDSTAIDHARRNADAAGLAADYHAAADADATGWLADTLDDHRWRVITNPARAGMSPAMAQFVGSASPTRRPEQLIYLSCDPQTLARDVSRLVDRGFEVRTVEPFDFMPQTDHIETLVVLEPNVDNPNVDNPNVDNPNVDNPNVDDPNVDKPDTTDSSMDAERAFQPGLADQRRFSLGVSGPAVADISDQPVDESIWVALVVGQTPKHGFLPKARDLSDQWPIQVDRLRNLQGNSVVRLRAQTLDDQHIRQRLRQWDHPVIGDPDFGDRQANHLASRHTNLDRLALHCQVAQAGQTRLIDPTPGQFLALMRLPRKVLDAPLISDE